MYAKFLSALVFGLAAAGCGALTARAATPGDVASGQDVAAFAGSCAALSAYTATVTIFDRKGAATQNIALSYAYRKPSAVTVHVVAGWNAGVTLSWNGAGTVTARRPSGLLALFSKTFSLHDPQVTTLRGASIDELAFGSILAHVQSEPGTLSARLGPVIAGTATDELTLIPTDPATDAGLTREVVELSAASHLPMRIQGYVADILVRDVEFTDVSVH